MLKKQRAFWNSLTWYEWAMVVVSMVGSALTTKSWLQIIIFIVRTLN